METYKSILAGISIILLIVGIVYRKKPWGQKLLYFALGIIVFYFVTDFVEGFVEGWRAFGNEIK
jgi:hypothetical protein